MTGRKIVKQACDACKIRKIKCAEVPPCKGCVASGVPCTFKSPQATRGPRKLRPKTIREIAQKQQRYSDVESCPTVASTSPPPGMTGHVDSAAPYIESSARTPLDILVLRLRVYGLRLFPVWPIIDFEDTIASLQREEEGIETYALANAVGAATIAQLKLDGDAVTGTAMEAECQRLKALNNCGPLVNLNTLRISFFLHVYHENQEAGGPKSLLYLREAITLAQIMGLHRESTYIALTPSEQQIRRRILWLLFITERGVAMLHKLPVVLKPNILFPSMDYDDDTRILPAFQKLTNLFWIFDQSGAFDILQDSDADLFNVGGMGSSRRSCIDLLQKKLQELPIDRESSNDVQRADICATRQWMRAVLWRASMNHGRFSTTSSISYPIQIAKEFLGVISQLPNTAIEAHGPSIEFKIYEIASAVIDAISNNTRGSWRTTDSSRDVLDQLHRILASSRGGNKMLLSMLCSKLAELHERPRMISEISPQFEELDDGWPRQSNTFPMFNSGINQLVGSLDFSAHQLYEESNDAREEHVTSPGLPAMQHQPQQQLLNFSWESELINNLLS